MIMFSLSFLRSSVIPCFKLTDAITGLTRSLSYKLDTQETGHVFKNVSPWTSKRELADYLLENILLNENGLIVLNKPYGVGMQPMLIPHERKFTTSRKTIIPNDKNYFLTDVLPYLGNSLGVDKLIIVKSTEMYSSGITFLATSDNIVERIQKCHRRHLSSLKLASKYLAVVLGRPTELSKKETVNFALVKSADGQSKQPLVQDAKRKPWKSKEMKRVRVQYNTISYSELGASLVEIRPSSTRWHFLRVYFAHLLSPVLGDNLYGSRVQTCLGATMAVNPFNETRQPQKLNRSIVEALDLVPGDETYIPCHIHLQEVTLSSFNEDKSDLTVVAPPTGSFMWTCEKLDLKIKA